jgi:phospholipid/cholesterol/gamma-HCH transport system ATP-binding protein
MVRMPRKIADDPVISAEQLTAKYGEQVVFEDVSFQVHRGEIFFIAGNSGGGKSTLLRQMIGLQPISSGAVHVLGRRICAEATIDPTLYHEFGVSFQGGALFGSRTILENVRLPLEQFTKLPAPLMDFIALTKLRLVGLEQAAEKLPAELSGGMQKRAALARALALDPKIVFLDEPSAGLDPLTSAALDELISELNRDLGTTFVVVSHELASIFALADRVAILDAARHKLVAIDTPEALLSNTTDPWVQAFFHRDISTVPSTVPGGSA